MLGEIGLVFAVVGMADLLLTWYPLGFGNPEWEFATVSQSLDGLPVPTLGLVLLLSFGIAHSRRKLVRGVSVILAVLALAIVAAVLMYATLVPLALGSVQDPNLQSGMIKAITKVLVQAIIYPPILLWIAITGWQRSLAPTSRELELERV